MSDHESQSGPYFSIWVVYKNPSDMMVNFVARQWIMDQGDTQMRADTNVIIGDTLNEVRGHLKARGLVMLPRDPSDDPVIVESWV